MTEIFATLGPMCSETDTLYRMLLEGMNGMRLNLSHTSLRESREIIERYDRARERAGVQAQLLIDLQGGELRIGRSFDCMLLETGSKVELLQEKAPGYISVPGKVFAAITDGDEILLDDGQILLRAEETGDRITASVIRGGKLFGGKSVKIPGKDIKGEILPLQDIENLRVCKDYGVTAIMQPFVTSGDDLRLLKEFFLTENISRPRIFAKIENMQGVDNLDSIIPEADMIVIARGDLGNDAPLWKLPAIQKRIEKACNDAGCPFLVVTQMLSSMISSAVPTRAEVSDVFNAVADGASAVMVTNETAIGNYPVEVIKYLRKTADEAEIYKREYDQR